MFSCIVRSIPTKTDMFHTFYTIIESISFAFMLTSVFFLMDFPLFGLIGGIVAFITVMIIYLILRKRDSKKDKLLNLVLIFTSSLFAGLTINFAIVSLSSQGFLMAIGAVVAFAYMVLQTNTFYANKKVVIAKNILLGCALIILALSIYFI